MIVKMRKYAFLVYHKEYEQFLQKLRDNGVVHVVTSNAKVSEDEKLSSIFEAHKRASLVLKELEKMDASPATDLISGPDIVANYYSAVKERDALLLKLEHLKKEITTVTPWGKFNPETISKLNDQGYFTHLFSCASRNFEAEWDKTYNLFHVNQIGSLFYFAVVSSSATAPDINADVIKMPEFNLEQLLNKQSKLQEQIDAELLKIKQLGAYVEPLARYKNELQQHLVFSEIVESGDKVANAKALILQGWVPDDKCADLEAFLNNEGVVYENRVPNFSEQVPILLKNNKFNKLFEMIGELYSMPKYSEMDLTPYFAPFYWLFFGFCLGDAGYGLLLLFGGFFMRNRVAKKLKNPLTLVGLLGISTILFGIIGGTFFGMNLYEMQFSVWGDVARHFDPANGGTKFNINDHLFNLALLLGAIQILFGMFIKVANETKMYGVRYAFGTIGWLTLIVGGLGIYGLTQAGISSQIITILTWVVVAIGGAGALLFNNPERNVLVNFGAGLWDAYNMATGLLGDLLSYIRLFALGISSAILGYVFNSLAVDLSPDLPVVHIIVMVLILLIGHGINLFMAALGSFVHPMRLTFVEFYKNSGFQGGGKKYQPFETINK